jgi:hypothetical protein
MPAAAAAAPLVRQSTRVRPFADADIAHVARVHRAAFQIESEPSLDSYRDYFRSVFLGAHAQHGALPSLVHEESDGRITGFVGLVPRRMVIDGRRYHALVSSQFIVDPASQVGLVATRLAKAYLEGPQDLSIADEANDVSKKIWEGLGGVTAMLLSMYWTRPLRPVRLATSFLRERRGLAPIAAAAAPFAGAADALAAHLPGSHFRQVRPAVDVEPLDGRAMAAHARDVAGADTLRVECDGPTCQWLLDRAAARDNAGRVVSGLVRQGPAILGWYVAHLDRHGVADVAQLAARPGSIHLVLDQLFYDAWRHGAVSVTGRLDARYAQALSDHYCLCHRRGPWVLVKTERPELLRALEAGTTAFSRLDGEWSLRYQP